MDAAVHGPFILPLPRTAHGPLGPLIVVTAVCVLLSMPAVLAEARTNVMRAAPSSPPVCAISAWGLAIGCKHATAAAPLLSLPPLARASEGMIEGLKDALLLFVRVLSVLLLVRLLDLVLERLLARVPAALHHLQNHHWPGLDG